MVGFHGTFFLMHLTGLLGMPRQIDVYPDNPEWVWLNLVSSVFGFVMTIGFALFVLDLVLQATMGAKARRAGGANCSSPRWTGRGLTMWRSCRATARCRWPWRRCRWRRGWLAAAALVGVVLNGAALTALAVLALVHMDEPATHARDALRGVLAGYAGVHLLAVGGRVGFVLDQTRRGEIGGGHAGALPVWRLWQDFAAATIPVAALLAAGLALLAAVPAVGGGLSGRLPRVGAWIGLVSTMVTPLPVAVATNC